MASSVAVSYWSLLASDLEVRRRGCEQQLCRYAGKHTESPVVAVSTTLIIDKQDRLVPSLA